MLGLEVTWKHFPVHYSVRDGPVACTRWCIKLMVQVETESRLPEALLLWLVMTLVLCSWFIQCHRMYSYLVPPLVVFLSACMSKPVHWCPEFFNERLSSPRDFALLQPLFEGLARSGRPVILEKAHRMCSIGIQNMNDENRSSCRPVCRF